MKRIALFMVVALSLYSCDMDDDGPSVAYEVAEITASDLPDYFELDKEYEINVDYLLPSACHNFAGFNVNQGENEENDSIFEYYVNVVASYDPALADCTNEDDDDLAKTATLVEDFEIKSENYNTYRFNFLSGFDNDDEPEYITIDVPVGEPEPETPEEDTNE